MALVRSVLGTIAAVVCCTTSLAAQATGSVRGRVLDSASSQGLTSVSVLVEGGHPGRQPLQPSAVGG